MPQLTYVAISSRTGEVVRGSIDAATQRDAMVQLEAQGLIPFDIHAPSLLSIYRRRIPVQLVADTLQQMAEMIATGVPLAQVLVSMTDEQEHAGLRGVLDQVRHAVIEEGLHLSQAMEKTPDVFPIVVTKRVVAGEKDGTLGDALAGSAKYLVQMARVRAKFMSAMSYPIMVAVIAVGIVSGLSVTVMPKFAGYFTQAHVQLPLMTRIVLGFGQLLAHHVAFVILGIVAVGVGTGRILSRPAVREGLDRFLWTLPGWRRIVRHLAWARFAQTLGTLYGHGINILDSLELACDSAGTAVIRDTAPLLAHRVTERTPLADALREAGVYSPRLITIAAWGEQHGTLDKMLLSAAEMYTHDVDLLLERIPQLVQPLMIVMIGGIVAVFVMSMYWPMFSLYNVIASGGFK